MERPIWTASRALTHHAPFMALTVVVRSGDLKSHATISFDAPRIVIGRGEGCEVRLPDPSVSHRHASIRQRGTDYVVIDEGSSNGTFVGPVRLSPHAPRVVRSGDLIRVGRIWLELCMAQVVPTQNAGLLTKEIALALVASSLSAEGELSAPRVSVTAGPDLGKQLALMEFERAYTLGRAQTADLTLSDPDASRRHVDVIRRGTQLLVRDLGSKNGATLGEAALVAHRDTAWPAYATLRFGGNEFGYEDPVLAALVEIEAGGDEPMQDDDSIDPPNIAMGRGESISTEPAARLEGEPRSGAQTARDLVSAAKAQGFRAVDVLIAVIALVVIALSILGLTWIFRAN